MLRYKRGSIEWLEFELFQEFSWVCHGIFLRHGGVSCTPYQTLNVGEGIGDDVEHTRLNRQRIQEIVACSQWVEGQQVHGATVVPASCHQDTVQCDGLLTSKTDMGLLIKHADCQAAIFYDPVLQVVGNIHAGWRGSVQNIYFEAVQQLQKLYGSKPENILVGISPSLGPCCAQFVNYQTEFPSSFWQYQVQPCYFDLWALARDQLIQVGILPHHLQIAGICTCCHPEDYFSYRRERISGRHATIVILKPRSIDGSSLDLLRH